MSTSEGRSSAELQADEDITASHDTGIDHARQQGEMFTCNSCHEEVDTVIRCDICDNLYDCRCAGMRYDTFMILLSIVNDCGWVCSDCRRIQKTVVNRLATSLAKTNETVADMKCTVDKLKEDIDCMKGGTLQLPETTSVEVRKAVSEISRRKHNVFATVTSDILTIPIDCITWQKKQTLPTLCLESCSRRVASCHLMAPVLLTFVCSVMFPVYSRHQATDWKQENRTEFPQEVVVVVAVEVLAAEELQHHLPKSALVYTGLPR